MTSTPVPSTPTPSTPVPSTPTPSTPVPLTPAASRPARPDAAYLRAIQAAALGVPGVVALTAVGGTGTSLPDGRIDGVRLRPDHTEVDVHAAWGGDLVRLGDAVRSAVRGIRPAPVTVRIVEIDGPGDRPEPAARTRRRTTHGRAQ